MEKKQEISVVEAGSRKRLAELRLQLEQVSHAWAAGDYEALLKFYVHIVPKLLNAERCTVYIIELGSEKIYSKYGTDLDGKIIEPPRGESIAGQVISTGTPVVRNDLNVQKGYHKEVDAGTGFVSRNTVCAPIKSVTGQRVIGAIQVLNKISGSDFTDADLGLLSEVAYWLSQAIENIVINQEILSFSVELNREVDRLERGFFQGSRFVAESQAMQKVLDLVRVVCATPVNVLIQGENGTGKELIARVIHDGSSRRDKTFVAVNCASIPEHLMESEFFGYEKGAFTGADRKRKGRFEEAFGGTLFLDEIADMPLVMQPKFLRAIQEREGCRLGSNEVIHYEFRIVSASNKNLKEEVAAGRFREDLYFRLFSVEVLLPPLRERRDDIIPLAMAFREEIENRFNKKTAGFSSEVLSLFEKYSWSGNVRQLQREVERLVALTPEGEYIVKERCSTDLLQKKEAPPVPEEVSGQSLPEQVKNLEVKLIESALEETCWNRLKAAQQLGITRQGLHKKMKRYGIEKE